MATSAINFQGLLTLNSDLNKAEREFTFRPPSNIAGKLCYVDVKAFALSWDETYTTPQSYHSYLLRSSWTQPQSGSVETNSFYPEKIEGLTASATVSSTTAPSTDYFTLSCSTTANSNSVTVAGNITTGVVVGMKVTGFSVPDGTTVTGVAVGTTDTTLTLSQSVTLGGTITLSFYAQTITVSSATGIEVGMLAVGSNIPDNTLVSAVSGTSVTLSNYVTGDVGTVTFYPYYVTISTSNNMIQPGMTATVNDTSYLSTDTTVTGVSGTKITLSNPVLATMTSKTIYFLQEGATQTQQMNAPLALLNYGSMETSSLPVLVSIPSGPHTVKFSVARTDKNVIGLSTSDITLCVMMSIVPANSRQPPIGV